MLPVHLGILDCLKARLAIESKVQNLKPKIISAT